MEFFRVPEGPWQKVFEGNFQGHGTALYANDSGTLMAVVLDGEAEKPNGVLLEFFRAFKCEGQLEGFVETLPREARVIVRHSAKRTSKFFLLASEPTYAAYAEEDVMREAGTLLRKLAGSAEMVKDVSKAYDLKLRELRELPEEEKAELFSDPLAIGISGPSAVGTLEEQPSVLKGELVLGISQSQELVREPLSLFKKTLVLGQDSKQRRHAMHIIAEGTLLSNTPVVIIDPDDSYAGLSEPTAQLSELKKYKVETEPIGFPVKQFKLGEDFFVELNKVNPIGLMELYGAGEGAAVRAIEIALAQKKAATMQQLIGIVRAMEATEELNEYQKNRAARILELIDNSYPYAFGGTNNIAEISKSWIKGIGRAGIIRLAGLDERVSLLAVHTIALELLEYYKAKGKANGVRSMLLVPGAGRFLPLEPKNVFCKEIASALSEATGYGLGFALEIEKEIDLDKGLAEGAEAEITLVQDNDAGVRLAGKKQYRVFVRPGLSKCGELS